MFTVQELERLRKHDEKAKNIRDGHMLRLIRIPFPDNSHQRSYMKGDIRCVNCMQWFNPWEHPEDWKHIIKGKRGKMRHKDCPVRSAYVASFATTPRHRPSRRQRLLNVKRY